MSGIGKTVYAGTLAALISPCIDEIIENPGIGRDWPEVLRNPLPGRRFDLIIDTQRRFKTTMIVKRIPHGRFVSGAVNYRLSSGRPQGRYSKKPRMIDNMLDLVEAASGQRARIDSALALALDPELTALAERAIPPGPRYAGYAPGAGGKHKQWPRDRFVLLATILVAKGMTPVFILGPDEAGWVSEIRQALPEALFPLQETTSNPATISSPLFTIAVGARLNVGVANDSGTGHMLAAADIPLVSLFGPTASEKFAPLVSHGTVVRAQDFGSDRMDAISVDAVLAAVDRIAPRH